MSCKSPKDEKEPNHDMDSQIFNNNDSEKKLNFFEMNLKFRNKINIDYTDYDFQKGELSPKLLFRKRKFENVDSLKTSSLPKDSEKQSINSSVNKNNISNTNEDASASKTFNKIKNVFDNYLEFVHESYFENDRDTAGSENKGNNQNNPGSINDDHNDNDAKKSSIFKFSSLDLLMNPLRKKFVFEMWNPYEIALFECCVSKFNKNFDLYPKIIRSKSKEDIINFYFYWKQSRFYKVWKNSRSRKTKIIK